MITTITLLPFIAPSCLTLASWVPKLQPPSDWTFGKLTRFGRVEMDKREQQTMRTCFSSRTFVGPTRYSSTVAYLTNHWLTKVAAQERNKKALFDENIVSNIWKNAETVTYPVPLYKLTNHLFFLQFPVGAVCRRYGLLGGRAQRACWRGLCWPRAVPKSKHISKFGSHHRKDSASNTTDHEQRSLKSIGSLLRLCLPGTLVFPWKLLFTDGSASSVSREIITCYQIVEN